MEGEEFHCIWLGAHIAAANYTLFLLLALVGVATFATQFVTALLLLLRSISDKDAVSLLVADAYAGKVSLSGWQVSGGNRGSHAQDR